MEELDGFVWFVARRKFLDRRLEDASDLGGCERWDDYFDG